MSTLSTHILDISTGRPAAGVSVHLEQKTGGQYALMARQLTDANGRIAAFVSGVLPPGQYRLIAQTGAWFSGTGRETVFVSAQIEVMIGDDAHYHLPFLIAPGGWSTYRGS